MKRIPLDGFGRIVARVMETLPEEFKQYLDNVVVDVEEEPDVETLRRMDFTEEEIALGESLYGLFAPLDLPSNWGGEAVDLHDLPHRIIIYKRPLEADFPDRRQLIIEIRKTVIHELAHHFGYSDRDLERFDDNPDPFGDDIVEPQLAAYNDARLSSISQRGASMRPNPVKRALKAGQPSVGTWLSLGSITAARFMAHTGFAWLTVDIEHSLVDWETATHMFATIADAGCIALARVPSNRHDHIKRVLDNGAHGVVVPMVNSREEAQAAVTAMMYPPVGNRSVGGSVHAFNFGATSVDYFAKANDELLVVLQCEHIKAVEDADAIFSVPGIDAIFVGPNDLAASMRSQDGKPPSGEATAQAMKHVLATCRKHKVAAGVHCTSAEEAAHRIEEGWQFIAIGSELRLMLDGTNDLFKKLGGGWQRGELAKY